MPRRTTHVATLARAAGVGLALLPLLPLLPASVAAQARRSPTAGATTMLVLEGAPVPARSVHGGTASAEVVVGPPGPDGATKKQLGAVRWEDIVIEVGPDAEPIAEWIAAAWSAKAMPKSGSLTTVDANDRATDERMFRDAQIVETTIPTLDASSRETGYLIVRAAPASVQTRDGSGQQVQRTAGPKRRVWLVSNFGFQMDGLEVNRISRIDSFTVRGPGASAPGAGLVREARRPGAVQFPNLTVTFSEESAKSWRDWYQSFVVKGENGDAAERSGAIVLLAPDMKSEIARIALSNCGIMSLAPTPEEGGAARTRTMRAELYCERMAFEPKGGP